ncbi:unnamed protein product [Cuscuta epithymum]|uniref:Glycosyltransferase 61 catalytic domain-containing protein n=1 Tax=Cuscuta epithymum TaxID=186058 RepID=A0AAV0FTH9_9ASTE|nr:unnamed protein product [Cuscuta epithymum]
MINRFKLKILLSLFALNSITLYLYLSSSTNHFRHKSPPNHHLHSSENRFSSFGNYPHSSSLRTKPWPILPSYLPWSQKPDAAPRSCEAYFGNGFTRRVDLLGPSAGGWFGCFHSETLQSSICEGGRVRMSPDKIRMSKGGEKLETVRGRGEDEEMPVFESGAFDIYVADPSQLGKKLVDYDFLNRYVPQGSIGKHTMRSLIDSIQLVSEDDFQCTEWIEEPTLLVTRFEYANLFHTFTDWYSAYVASRVTGLPTRPHLVFVDGHCQTQLEETWKALFSSIRYAKNFSGPVCFRHVILSPLGYETALFKGLSGNINCQGAPARDLWENPNDKKTARLHEFGEMVKAAFRFPVNRLNNNISSRPATGHNILFVRREDYFAHPRHGGKVQSRLINEEDVFDSVKNWVASSSSSNNFSCKVNVVNGLFGHMSMKEQVRAIQDASVIVGAHGAGLTHIISAMPRTVILEIISSEYRRPHFALIAQWKGLEYHPIFLDGSYANPSVVIDKLSSILKGSFGC